ncbi:hypothetical protein COY27_06440 [Candidatus Woesearchaeota archaeon CG_4_10_14_0_2_um_filter_33_13]|nr:MAG: hypothetical protein COY27_06440 [Candidatus Woesearchaeota archaeon CG_4_10_14_0_2_um_filter_33_13]
MKRLFVFGILISFLFLVGCGNETYSSERVVNCEEGKYSIPSEMNKQLKLAGTEGKSLNIVGDDYNCKVSLELKETMLVLDSEINALPVLSCDKKCMENTIKNQGISGKKIKIIVVSTGEEITGTKASAIASQAKEENGKFYYFDNEVKIEEYVEWFVQYSKMSEAEINDHLVQNCCLEE